MFARRLLIITYFACGFAGNPAELSPPCSASQSEAKQVCIYYHESILRLTREVMPAVLSAASKYKDLCGELIPKLESASQACTGQRPNKGRYHLTNITSYLESNKERISAAVAPVREIMIKSHAAFIEAYRYFEYIKQYLSVAGLYCDYECKFTVNLKEGELMGNAEIEHNTRVLAEHIALGLKSFNSEYNKMCERGLSGKPKYSIAFYVASLRLHQCVLKELYHSTSALVRITDFLAYMAMASPLSDDPVSDATPGPAKRSRLEAPTCRLDDVLRRHLTTFLNASRALPREDTEWDAKILAAIALAETQTARLSAHSLLDVPMDQLPCTGAFCIDLQEPALDVFSPDALQEALYFEY
ncbi:hypothetical protein PAPHI01_1327 [Pancytospora philotis]|nr:hypothetical protein PAPHI01_1327 [Pancytospora philotis]